MKTTYTKKDIENAVSYGMGYVYGMFGFEVSKKDILKVSKDFNPKKTLKTNGK